MRITFARACRLAAPLAAALLVPALSAHRRSTRLWF
jgi:hypothetical protein